MRSALVLAYHGLGRYSRELDPHNLMVDPAKFRRQISTLQRRGCRFVSLTDLVADMEPKTSTNGMCALTFDDGTVDNLEVVAPLLLELDVPATVFVCPGLLGEDHFSMPAEAGVRLMDADQLRELACSPLVEIGSHTSTHTDLSQASPEEAYREMTESKLALEDLLGKSINSFAYPKCCYSPACPEAARRAGYAVAVTCGNRGGWRRFELGRESVDSLDSQLSFALKSRRLFVPLRNSAPGRLMRSTVRPLRHGGAE